MAPAMRNKACRCPGRLRDLDASILARQQTSESMNNEKGANSVGYPVARNGYKMCTASLVYMGERGEQGARHFSQREQNICFLYDYRTFPSYVAFNLILLERHICRLAMGSHRQHCSRLRE